jgi:hypothetical protein
MKSIRVSGACGICVLLLHVGPARATTSARAQSSVEVEVGADTTRIHKVNRTFDVVSVPAPNGGGRTLVLEMTVETEESPPVEGYSLQNVVLRAFEVTKSTKKEQFTIHGKGESARKLGGLPFFVVSELGLSHSNNTHSVYSLVNGSRLFFAGGGPDILRLDTETGWTGYYVVGVHASGSARDAEVYQRPAKEMEASLLVTYASLSAPLDAVRVTLGAHSTRVPRVTSIRWGKAPGVSEDGRIMAASEKRLMGDPAVVEIAVVGVGRIAIPIRNGRLDESAATVPGGVHIEHASVAKLDSH